MMSDVTRFMFYDELPVQNRAKSYNTEYQDMTCLVCLQQLKTRNFYNGTNRGESAIGHLARVRPFQ